MYIVKRWPINRTMQILIWRIATTLLKPLLYSNFYTAIGRYNYIRNCMIWRCSIPHLFEVYEEVGVVGVNLVIPKLHLVVHWPANMVQFKYRYVITTNWIWFNMLNVIVVALIDKTQLFTQFSASRQRSGFLPRDFPTWFFVYKFHFLTGLIQFLALHVRSRNRIRQYSPEFSHHL